MPADSIQIINNSRLHHRLVASATHCLRNEVKIYDFLLIYPDAKVHTVIKNLTRNPLFIMVEMDKQKSSYDCGIYASVVATSLAFGIDPTDITFKQDAMRNQLIHSFEIKQLCVYFQENISS